MWGVCGGSGRGGVEVDLRRGGSGRGGRVVGLGVWWWGDLEEGKIEGRVVWVGGGWGSALGWGGVGFHARRGGSPVGVGVGWGEWMGVGGGN